jgi:GT2 family glycosyltransferase
MSNLISNWYHSQSKSAGKAVQLAEARVGVGRVATSYGNGGYLEMAWCNRVDNCAFVAGWVAHDMELTPCLEYADGRRLSLDSAFRFLRQDLVESDHPALGRTGGVSAAFNIAVPDVREGEVLRLILVQGERSMLLSEVAATPLPRDPVTAFRQSMNLFAPQGRMTERFGKVDWPVLGAMQALQCQRLQALAVDVHDVGPQCAQPLVSLIIPLYRRFDFVEPQLIKFSQDAWLREHAQIIYVIDDPALVETMRSEAPALFDLHRVPFCWVWGQANRGFSGANNLGASVATAPRLLFLNSDVFPLHTGWAPALLEVLAQRPDVGAVAPLLLHTDGTIQHAGMAFRHADEFGIWTNYHPDRGLDPTLTQRRGLVDVPAVTGACLAMRRSDFDAIGGWDTGYLIGDFEDSDLCLSLRAKGLGSVCLMDVRLTHLERQSFASLGDPGFRTGVVILNATRHQTRWAEQIAQLART